MNFVNVHTICIRNEFRLLNMNVNEMNERSQTRSFQTLVTSSGLEIKLSKRQKNLVLFLT